MIRSSVTTTTTKVLSTNHSIDSHFSDYIKGTSTSFTGEIRSGIPHNGRIENLNYCDGIFSGTIKDGKPYNGTVTDIKYKNGKFSGCISEGNWHSGKAIKMDYDDGVFDGEIRHNKPHNGIISRMKYQGGEFTGEIRNGKPYNGNAVKIQYKQIKFTGEIRMGGLSNGKSTFKRTLITTPFQHILRAIDLRNTQSDVEMKRLLMGFTSSSHLALTDDDKYDINNDVTRRYFESIFASRILVVKSSNDSFERLNILADALLNMLKNIVEKTYLQDWKSACSGDYSGSNTTLRQFSINMKKVGEFLPGTQEQKDMLTKIYKLHYLQYNLESCAIFKNLYPQGILDGSICVSGS